MARLVAFFASPPELIRKAKKPEGLFKLPWEKGSEQSGFDALRKHFEALDKAVKAKEAQKQNGDKGPKRKPKTTD